MALDSAYAAAAQYRARVGLTSTDDDSDILEQLQAGAREIEGNLGLPLGAFNASEAAVTRYFDGSGTSRLRLRDDEGLVNAIQTIDVEGIQVDTDRDGAFATTFDPTTEPWVVPFPFNASERSEPWNGIRLLPLSGATASVGEVLTVFPEGVHNVRLIGTWGWAAVPDLIRELNIKITRDIRDSLVAGPGGELEMLDSGVVVRGDTWRFWLSARRRYSHKLPGTH